MAFPGYARWFRWIGTLWRVTCGVVLAALLSCSREPKSVAPAGKLFASSVSPSTGLQVTFGPDPVVSTRAAAPQLALAHNEPPHPAIASHFTAAWSGSLRILEGGSYHFRTPGGRLLVGDQQIQEEQAVELNAGRHPLRVAIVRQSEDLAFRLEWKSEHFAWEPIPTEALAYDATLEVLAGLQLERGLSLLEELGCVACHQMPIEDLVPRRAPDLTHVAGRIRPQWIHRWLGAPHSFRRSAAMPAMLSKPERLHVVGFLASLTHPPDEIPLPGILLPGTHSSNRGAELYKSVGCAPCHDQPGLKLEGLGSKYFPQALAAYLEDPSVTSPEGRMPSLLLSPDEAKHLAAHLSLSRREEFEAVDVLLGSADPAQGRQLVETRGCLACHTLVTAPALENRHRAPPLTGTPKEQMGCLSNVPGRDIPRYDLSPADRDALVGVLATLDRLGQLHAAPFLAARRRLEALRCNACHTTDDGAAVLPPPERIPSLRGIGAKLKPEWIQAVLLDKRRVRPSLRTRMPHYPAAVVKPIANGLTALSGLDKDAPDPPALRDPKTLATLREKGVRHLGTQAEADGLSCIACHDFGPQKPIADEKGPQLLDTHARLRYDWFRRWMLAPGRLASGTSMPSYFTQTLEEEAMLTIDALWAAFSLRENIPPPPGLGTLHNSPMREVFPVATDEALVLRFPLEGTTAANINIALPRQGKIAEVSCAFDAARCLVVLAWQGGFIDLSESLGKRQKRPRLLGEVFFRSTTQPLRFGQLDRVPSSTRFRGYRIVDGFPEFRYELDGVDVRERIAPLWGTSGFTREFRITNVRGPAWFVEPTTGLTLGSTIGEFVDGRLPLPEGDDIRFDVIMARENSP